MVTGPAESLLRVSGKPPRRRASGPRPTLIVEGPTAEHRYRPLSAPRDRGGVLRAAYAIPTALMQSGARCWLEFADGTRAELPVPEEGAARMRNEHRVAPAPMAPEPSAEVAHADADAAVHGEIHAEIHAELNARAEAAESEAASATARVAPLERRLAELEQAARTGNERIETLERDLAQVAPARQALEREVAKLRSQQANLEHELDRSRDQLRIMAFERDELSRQAAAFDGVAVKARERAAVAAAANEKTTATLQELQIWRGELERRLAETTSELGAARAARDTDERELMRLRATLAEIDRRSHDASPAANGGEAATIAAQAEEIERLAADLASLRARGARDA